MAMPASIKLGTITLRLCGKLFSSVSDLHFKHTFASAIVLFVLNVYISESNNHLVKQRKATIN